MSAPKHPRLAQEQRSEILRRLKSGDAVTALAREFGVSQSTVSQVKSRGIRPARATTTAGSVVAVRLSPVEMDALEQLKKRAGIESNSDAIRSLLRMAVGLLEFERDDETRLEEIRTELHKIGVNVNQIALAANRGRTDLLQHQWKELTELRRSLPEVRSYLKAVVDEQRRKGIRLYEKFGEGRGDV